MFAKLVLLLYGTKAEGGLVRASQEEGGGGSALVSWKIGFERCAIWDRVRAMLAEVRLCTDRARTSTFPC